MRSVPRTIRGAFAVLLTIVLLPSVSPPTLPEDVLGFPILLGSELLLGIAIGLTAALFVYSAQVAAEIIAVQMGLSIAGILAPTASGSPPGMAELQHLMALAIYVALGGHLVLIQGLSNSLQVIKPGVVIDFVAGGRALATMVGGLFPAAVRVAGPVMVALLLTNIAIAILGKAVPQLNVLMLAFPITIGVGLLVFGAALPFLGSLFVGWVESTPAMLEGITDVFAPATVGR